MTDKTEKRVTSGDVQDFAIAVEQLTEETHLLRLSLDELRDDVVWAARQVLAAGYQVTGTSPPPPRDPLAPDLMPSTVRSSKSPAFEHVMDQDLEMSESGPYCCEQPKLQWKRRAGRSGCLLCQLRLRDRRAGERRHLA